MSTSIGEVIAAAGFDPNTMEGARWIQSQMTRWDDLLENALQKIEDFEEEMDEEGLSDEAKDEHRNSVA